MDVAADLELSVNVSQRRAPKNFRGASVKLEPWPADDAPSISRPQLHCCPPSWPVQIEIRDSGVTTSWNRTLTAHPINTKELATQEKAYLSSSHLPEINSSNRRSNRALTKTSARYSSLTRHREYLFYI